MDMNSNNAGSDKEQELLLRYKNTHKQDILGELYNPYIPMVYGLCMKYFKQPADAEDAVMDIYIGVMEKLKRHDVKNLKSWLYVVSKNHCLDKLRARSSKMLKESTARLMYSEQIYHPDNEEDEDELRKLSRCLEKLPEDQKKCVDMFYFKKVSYQEITATTQFSWGQVRSFIQNGRRNLKNCMEKS